MTSTLGLPNCSPAARPAARTLRSSVTPDRTATTLSRSRNARLLLAIVGIARAEHESEAARRQPGRDFKIDAAIGVGNEPGSVANFSAAAQPPIRATSAPSNAVLTPTSRHFS